MLTGKNDRLAKYALLLFFGVAYVSNLIFRLKWHSILQNEFRWRLIDLEFMLLLMLIFLNPKGIKLLVSLVVLFLIVFTTYFEFLPMSGYIFTLIYKDLIYLLDIQLDSGLFYILHMMAYLGCIVMMFLKKRRIESEMIDQI